MRPLLESRVSAFFATAALTACSSPDVGDPSFDGDVPSLETSSVRQIAQAQIATEDALAVPYERFKARFIELGRDQRHTMGFGPTVMSTVEREADPAADAVRGSVSFEFENQRIVGSIVGLPAGEEFDLWLMKNGDGAAASVGMDAGDTFIFVGTFSDSSLLQKSLDEQVGDDVHFDLDAVVVTEKDEHPTNSLVFFGARTLFEKRFFDERAGLPMTPVTGALGAVATLDPLVARGADVFFNETFEGNGRTCGTCHRAENNLTIDPVFIATLPDDDPLFVAENVPELATLERPEMMRQFGVILENVDGMDDLENKFVLRAVNHTLALSTTLEPDTGFFGQGTPPDERTGWSGDGSPGRGTLQEFVIGAINQHFPSRLDREVGVDFRLPTQQESDALEAFQLFTGRHENPPTQSLTFAEERANIGLDRFLNDGACVACHRDPVGQENAPNFDFDTGIEAFTELSGLFPKDGGLGTKENPERPGAFGNGRFNVPPVIEAADTAPLFHNHIQGDIEDAVSFYQSAAFDVSPAAAEFTGPINITDEDTTNISIFLRTINAAENIRQVRVRVEFIKNNPGLGEEELFTMAIADTEDAFQVLQARQIELNPTARIHLDAARQTLIMAQAHPVGGLRDAYLDWALLHLNGAKDDLFVENPLDLF